MDGGLPVRGADFTDPCHMTAEHVLDAAASSGLQATQYAAAERVLQEVRSAREQGAASGRKVALILTYTSNMISCGLREVLTFLVAEGFVDAVISTAGGFEEDVIKCLGNTLVADFALKGSILRRGHLNRVGNLLIPNTNYANFEDFFTPVLAQCHARQCATGGLEGTTPSSILAAVGKQLLEAPGVEVHGVDRSLVATSYRRGVPMYSPAFTDGSMGDMLFFYNVNFPGLCVDPLADERDLRRRLADFDEINVFSIGAGLPKHNALRAAAATGKLRRVVLVTTSSELDGCTSSGSRRDDESAGQLLPDTTFVRLNTEATLVVPLLVARVFTALPSTADRRGPEGHDNTS